MRIRDELWKMAISRCKGGTVIQIWNDRSPQGYNYRVHGTPSREMVDFEGIALVRIPKNGEK
jgi:hypothetical protein